MTSNASRVRFPVDELLILQTEAHAALSATGASENKLDLQKMAAYWNSANDIAINQEFMIVIVVPTAPNVDTSQTYTPTIRTDTLASMGSATVIATLPDITAAGIYYYAVSREVIKALEADAGFMDINITIAGSGTKSFDYWAYASPFPNG